MSHLPSSLSLSKLRKCCHGRSHYHDHLTHHHHDVSSLYGVQVLLIQYTYNHHHYHNSNHYHHYPDDHNHYVRYGSLCVTGEKLQYDTDNHHDNYYPNNDHVRILFEKF